jgi:hypothetical protein
MHNKKLFLIDGIGVFVLAILLGLVLPHFQILFGMPQVSLIL